MYIRKLLKSNEVSTVHVNQLVDKSVVLHVLS